MDRIKIRGEHPLRGEVAISGSKNAALPILCASLLADGTHQFGQVPNLQDIHTLAALLRHLGLEVSLDLPNVRIHTRDIRSGDAPYELVKRMRASVLVLGPLVARLGRARVSLPGGCAIGARPIDQHLKGFESMGAEVRLDHGYVEVIAPGGRLRGAEVNFDVITVTGTENLLSAAVLAEGRTVLHNAACEPEVQELAQLLTKMGARIQGAGTPTIVVEGVRSLHPAAHSIVADRIEAGTFMVAVAATQGDACLRGVRMEHMQSVVLKLRQAGVVIERDGDGVCVAGSYPFRATDVTTAPYPDFPTDMQAQFMVLTSLSEGTSYLTETVFENRFMHVAELNRMGASISVQGHTARVQGVARLQGAQVMATDLRASASLIIAGLVARGETEVLRVYHLDRGYEHIEAKLSALGADILRVR